MARLVIGGGTTGAGIAYADALDKARARALTEMQLHMEAANAEANRAQNEKMAARQEAFQTGIEQGRQQHAAELQRGELTARQEEARLARAQGMEQFTTTEGRLKDQAAKASAIDEARLAIDEARLTLERLKQEGAPREVMESTATKAGANWSYDPALSRGQNEANLRAALSVKEKENIALKVAIDNELDLAGLPITPTNVTWAMKQKKIEERRAAWEKAGLEMGVVAPGGKPGEAAIKQEMMQKINQVYGDKLKALDEDNRIKVLNIVAEQGRAAASLGEPFDYPKALQQAMQFISPGKVKGGEGIPPSAPPTAIERAKA
ncbi:MAG: hypothetical protein Q8O57_08280, partial [Kiritimatiellota bacterium]|nr:hypothetical protein [Kiritimatiellota bacterium]